MLGIFKQCNVQCGKPTERLKEKSALDSLHLFGVSLDIPQVYPNEHLSGQLVEQMSCLRSYAAGEETRSFTTEAHLSTALFERLLNATFPGAAPQPAET